MTARGAQRRRGLDRDVTSGGGRTVGVVGGGGDLGGGSEGGATATGTLGRTVVPDFGDPAPPFGGKSGSVRPPSVAVTTGATTTGGGVNVAGRNAVLVWQSAHFVGKLAWPGNVLESNSGLWQVTHSLVVPLNTAVAPLPWQYPHSAFWCAPSSGENS